MDPVTQLILTGLGLAVWTYLTYFAVRKGVRDGLIDAQRRDSTNTEPESKANPE